MREITNGANAKTTEHSCLEEGARAFAYTALQKPLTALAEVVDHTAHTNLSKKVDTTMDFKPHEAEFGSKEWSAQLLGSSLGAVPMYLAINHCVGKVLPGEGLAAGLSRSAVTGFTGDFLSTPVGASDQNFWQDKAKHGVAGAITFSAMSGANIGLKNVVSNSVARGGLSGAFGGMVGAESDSLLFTHQFATHEQLTRAAVETGIMGSAFGLLPEKRVHEDPVADMKASKGLLPLEPKPDSAFHVDSPTPPEPAHEAEAKAPEKPVFVSAELKDHVEDIKRDLAGDATPDKPARYFIRQGTGKSSVFQKMYRGAFEKSERDPLGDLTEWIADGSYHLNQVHDAANHNKLVGFEIGADLSEPGDAAKGKPGLVAMWYFAVAPELRYKGIGSQIRPLVLDAVREQHPNSVLMGEIRGFNAGELPTRAQIEAFKKTENPLAIGVTGDIDEPDHFKANVLRYHFYRSLPEKVQQQIDNGTAPAGLTRDANGNIDPRRYAPRYADINYTAPDLSVEGQPPAEGATPMYIQYLFDRPLTTKEVQWAVKRLYTHEVGYDLKPRTNVDHRSFINDVLATAGKTGLTKNIGPNDGYVQPDSPKVP